jgi:hypothetical protein
MSCDSEQQKVDTLQDLYETAKENCHDGLKAACGQAATLLRELADARAALARCLNQPIASGSVFPKYVVTNLFYSPPGKGSEAAYTDGSTAGSTVDVSKSFKQGTELGASGNIVGNGVEVSVGIKGGIKSGSSFEIKKETTSGVTVQSNTDGVDHSKDVFFVWTNVQVDMDERTDNVVTVGLGASGNLVPPFDIVSLTVAELRNPSLIPQSKQTSIANLTADDYQEILKCHPLLTSSIPNPDRFIKITTALQLRGPDQAGDSGIFINKKITNEQATGVVTGTSIETSSSIQITEGIKLLFLDAQVKEGISWEWSYETEIDLTTGQTQEAEFKLGSSTVGYYDVIDVYYDITFQTFAFVSLFEKVLTKHDEVASAVFKLLYNNDHSGLDIPTARDVANHGLTLNEELAGLRQTGSTAPVDYSDLTGATPNQYWPWPNLTGALTNLATINWEAGDQATSAANWIRRIQVEERLTATDPTLYKPALANTTFTLLYNNYRTGLDKPTALDLAKRGLTLYEELANLRQPGSTAPVDYDHLTADKPNQYWPWPNLTGALANLATINWEAGDRVTSAANWVKRIQVEERLTATDPTINKPVLANTIFTLLYNNYVSGLDTPTALDLARRGLTLYEELAGLRQPGSTAPIDYDHLTADTPNQYWGWPHLTGALTNIATITRHAGDQATAATWDEKRQRVDDFLANHPPQ